MARYYTANGWRATEGGASPVTTADTGESLVQRGLLHPEALSMANLFASESPLLEYGLNPGALVRLTDGPGGVARYATYYDVMMCNPWGHGTLHTIARGLSRLPLRLYKERQDADPGSVAEVIHADRKGGVAGQIAWALRYPMILPGAGERSLPNAPRSRMAMLYGAVMGKNIYGNAFWEIRRDAEGAICGFTFHPAEAVDMDQDNLIYKVLEKRHNQTIYLFTGREREKPKERLVSPGDMVHFGFWESGRSPWNPSPVRALAASIALYDAVSRQLTSYFQNGARPSGHIRIENSKDDRAREVIRQEVLKLYAGTDAAGKIMVTSGEYTPLHREPQFDGIVNLAKMSRDEIFVTYGVPPPVMGVIERAIMSNVREMRDQYVRDLIGPIAALMAADFESQVLDPIDSVREQNVFAEFDLDDQLRPDLWKRAASFRNILLAYTPEELRRIERQPELPTEADPHGYSKTIQRPLNESPLNNMPNYVERDALQERRVELEETRLTVTTEQQEKQREFDAQAQAEQVARQEELQRQQLEMQREQQRQQLEQQKQLKELELQQQRELQELQLEFQMKQLELQMKMQEKQLELQMKLEEKRQDKELELQEKREDKELELQEKRQEQVPEVPDSNAPPAPDAPPPPKGAPAPKGAPKPKSAPPTKQRQEESPGAAPNPEEGDVDDSDGEA
jgi:HK97 family phage portal protein